MDKIQVLKNSDLFSLLSDEQIAFVEKMCTRQVFEAGAIINKQGSKVENLHIVEDGLVGIILEVGPLAKRQLQHVRTFESFGWSAMTEPYLSTATAQAIHKTTVLSIKGQDMCGLCKTHPEIACKTSMAIARVCGARLQHAFMQLLGVSSQD